MSGALEGSRVGRYRLEAHLGTGGMGSVYRAHDTVLERDVAIKLVSRGPEAGPEAQARLLREGQALARLDHPHVVRIFDVGRSEHGLFVAMELVDGRTFARWVDEEKPAWRAIVRTYVQAGAGVDGGAPARHRASRLQASERDAGSPGARAGPRLRGSRGCWTTHRRHRPMTPIPTRRWTCSQRA